MSIEYLPEDARLRIAAAYQTALNGMERVLAERKRNLSHGETLNSQLEQIQIELEEVCRRLIKVIAREWESRPDSKQQKLTKRGQLSEDLANFLLNFELSNKRILDPDSDLQSFGAYRFEYLDELFYSWLAIEASSLKVIHSLIGFVPTGDIESANRDPRMELGFTESDPQAIDRTGLQDTSIDSQATQNEAFETPLSRLLDGEGIRQVTLVEETLIDPGEISKFVRGLKIPSEDNKRLLSAAMTQLLKREVTVKELWGDSRKQAYPLRSTNNQEAGRETNKHPRQTKK